MAYKLQITRSASEELEHIIDYISNHLNNPSAAADFLDKTEACYQRLMDNPKIYQLCDYPEFKEKNYRKAIIKNYVLIYRIDETTQTVNLLHFFFGRQNYFSIL